MEYKFYKNSPTDLIWWVFDPECREVSLFSFDKKAVFNMFADYPNKLTERQKEIFDKENPKWADFFKDRDMDKKTQTAVMAIVRSYGFDSFGYVTGWNGCEVYAPYNKDGSVPCIGQPVFILVKQGQVRIAAEKEWKRFIGKLPD